MKPEQQIARLRAVAVSKGGECMITEYRGMHARCEWRCSSGHVWSSSPNGVVHSGSWCPSCAGVARRSIHDCREAARVRGGECLSEHLRSIQSFVEWRCSAGHRWKSRACNVLNSNAWCPTCAGRRHSLAEFQGIAEARGGACISVRYRGMQSKLLWRCAEGHQWSATPATILHGEAWCPQCAAGLGERLTRAALESLLGQPFPRTRPDWLRAPNGQRLELDGYCDSLRIAFEHQGDQHYRESAYHGGSSDFSLRQEYDQIKRSTCAAKGVFLVEVPQVGTGIRIRDLVAFLTSALQANGIGVPNADVAVDFRGAYSPKQDSETWDALLRIIAERGGATSAVQYLGSREPIPLRCQQGHSWETNADSLHRGKWCPFCAASQKASKSRNSIERIAAIAESRGGSLLSTTYSNGRAPLTWRCQRGHEWLASFNTIRCGSWCPTCARARQSMDRRQSKRWAEFAALHGGEFEGYESDRPRARLRFRCQAGHAWLATASSSGRGAWCPRCSRRRFPLSIEEMVAIASARGGKCLSATYMNSATKLMWACSRGHVWAALPSAVKRGQWCRRCVDQARRSR